MDSTEILAPISILQKKSPKTLQQLLLDTMQDILVDQMESQEH